MWEAGKLHWECAKRRITCFHRPRAACRFKTPTPAFPKGEGTSFRRKLRATAILSATNYRPRALQATCLLLPPPPGEVAAKPPEGGCSSGGGMWGVGGP